MRRRGQTTTFQERLEIGEKAEVGYSDPEIAGMIDCSVPTVRKWRRRYQKQGRVGLVSKMGRPATGALGSKPAAMREIVREWREGQPGWGPDTLLSELERRSHWRKGQLPSRSRIAAFLKQEGLTRRYQKHTALPQPEGGKPQRPHEEWEMDAQGPVSVRGLSKTSTINVIDVASRLKVESYPCVGTTKPGVADFMLALRRAFLQHGLPERISLDHDAAFFQNTSTSPYPMPIHLWLIALGVDVAFIRKGRPTDHAIIERHHQTMEAQALRGPRYSTLEALWRKLDERRTVLNRWLPTHIFGRRAPLTAFPDAQYSGRAYRPEWEEELLSPDRVYRYLAQGRWFRSTGNNGRFQLGGHWYYIGTRYRSREVEITFDAEEVAFICQPAGSEEVVLVPALGLTRRELMGDLADILRLPAYQLALPFTRTDKQRLELAQFQTDTTFRDNGGTIK